jgi:ferredoxin
MAVDLDRCIGCGACVALCPKSFKMKENKAEPVKAQVAEISCEKDAADNCPVQAITIEK